MKFRINTTLKNVSDKVATARITSEGKKYIYFTVDSRKYRFNKEAETVEVSPYWWVADNWELIER